jgi:hypothetical protein
VVTGCAGAQTARERDFASGRWSGEIQRDGLSQPLALDIQRDEGIYRGEWRLPTGLRGRRLENVEVQGDEVRFETDRLRFVGHVTGDTLSGVVTQKPADARVGEFSVTHEAAYSPASEWAPDVIP